MNNIKQKYTTIDQYIATFPDDLQAKLEDLRKVIKAQLPAEVVECISYGIPVFKLNDKFVIYFAGYKSHISIYPIPPAPEAFIKKLEPYIAGKGTLKFKLDEPIPMNLVKEIVKYSVQRNKESKAIYDGTKSKKKNI